MKNAESLKGKIKAFAIKNRLRPQEVLQMYFFERFLERLSRSKHRDILIIKGGLLISSMIGVANRTTMDMDTTVKGFPLNEESLRIIVEEILSVNTDDAVQFEIDSIGFIHEDSPYENFRVHLIATYGKIENPMKIDITTGDLITPGEILWCYECLFESKKINVMAYPLETVLAEKFETVITRNIATTRMRDFYDIHVLYVQNKDALKIDLLQFAIERTASYRGSMPILHETQEIIDDILSDEYLNALWRAYQRENSYVGTLDFKRVVESLKDMAQRLGLY